MGNISMNLWAAGFRSVREEGHRDGRHLLRDKEEASVTLIEPSKYRRSSSLFYAKAC